MQADWARTMIKLSDKPTQTTNNQPTPDSHSRSNDNHSRTNDNHSRTNDNHRQRRPTIYTVVTIGNNFTHGNRQLPPTNTTDNRHHHPTTDNLSADTQQLAGDKKA
jgi:hypothetical protein